VKRALRHLPNLVTSFRLAAAPATAGLLTTGHFEAALGIFAAAGLSDAVDGYLAKRFGLASKLGAYLDPAADKALMLAAFIALTILGAVPLWLTLIVLAREVLFVLAIGLAIALQIPLVIRPLLIGKVGTALQVLFIVAHLAALAFGFSLDVVTPGADYVLAGVLMLSVVAYAAVWRRTLRAAAPEGASKA
jgi:cardiolipin synthase